MGIGNTASAALIMHRLTPAPLAACIGRGAGHDAAGLSRKTAAVERAAARSAASAPLDVLAEFGGLEIAMMAGLVLGGAARRRVVIVDGFISTVAALSAIRDALKARRLKAREAAARAKAKAKAATPRRAKAAKRAPAKKAVMKKAPAKRAVKA